MAVVVVGEKDFDESLLPEQDTTESTDSMKEDIQKSECDSLESSFYEDPEDYEEPSILELVRVNPQCRSPFNQ